ncbi:MAG: hypothetical protein HY263_08960, partial [Chloroflexi bacterium]|nr:hypothetical protein [Chloroflexota bacterium]
PARARIRLVLGQPPARFSQERLAAAYHGTCWALGREAAALLPLEPLLGPAIRAPWSWQAATLRRSLEAVAPHLARDGRVVLLLESGGPEALVAAALGGVGAGYRLVEARLAEPDEEVGGIVELIPPGGILPPPARSRGNQVLDPGSGGRGDPEAVPGPGLFAPPERIDARPFSAVDAARSIADTAVEVLKARGEPARYERLLGEILVGLDRAGQLRRLVATEGRTVRAPELTIDGDAASPPPGIRSRPLSGAARWAGSEGRVARAAIGDAARVLDPASDPVERVLALVRDELTRPGQRRLEEIEPGRWWLGDRLDRQSASVPLADRVEWAAFSLLSTAGPIDEVAFFERVAALFTGHDLPDETLVRACLAASRPAESGIGPWPSTSIAASRTPGCHRSRPGHPRTSRRSTASGTSRASSRWRSRWSGPRCSAS